jgi:dephospho-CoA kinase
MANRKPKEILLCFTGMPGSGKTTAAEIMKKKGYRVVEMSTGALELMKKEGIEVTNTSIRRFCTELREKEGNDVFGRLTAQLVSEMKGKVAIFGVRGIREVNYFKLKLKDRDVYLIALIIPQRLRFRRIKSKDRKRKDETRTWEEFVQRDKIETGWGLKEAIDNADFIISNCGTKSDLSGSITELMQKINLFRKQDFNR